jgi:putative ABC transport system substrate-binding protein
MKRRSFIAGLGSAAAWPLVARGQKPVLPIVGYLHAASASSFARPLAAFKDGLRAGGYVEGENIAVEYRWAEGHSDRLPALAARVAM